MKKRYVQKMLTMVLTAAMICSSVPVAAETVSENETAVTVDTAAKQETAEKPELEADEEAQPEEAGETVEEADAADIEADMLETEDTEVENGKEGYLSYRIYQKPDETKYVEITECDYDAKGAVEIPTKIKNIAVTSIGNGAFNERTKLTSIEIPSSVTSIGERAFGDCSGLTSIEIPSSVTSIGEKAFMGCSRLTGIEIPAGVTSIGSSAFYGCSGLTSIEIPAGVTSIGYGAFYGCSGLTSINVEAGNVVYDSRDNCNAIIEKETNTLIQGCKNTKIPPSVTSIGESAFSDCSGLTSIEIPSSVTSIGNYAFRDCIGLKDVYYTGTQEQWNAISFGYGGDASDVFVIYDEDLDENISIPFTLHCNSSESAPSASPSPKSSEQPSVAPSATPSEKPSAAPSAAPSVTPSEQPSAKPSAAPSKTPEADVPAAGTTLKEKTGREYKVTKSDSSKGKPSVTLTKLSAKEKKAKKVTIPKTVTVDNVEYQVTGIKAKAFKNSKKLQSIVIPDTITEIGASSFEGCKNLKSVTIGKNVTSIGKNAFKNCKNLKKITVKSTKLKKVGKGALTGINRKCVIKVPKKKLKSYKSLFKGKGQKKSVKIK